MEITINHGENLVISLNGRLDTTTSVQLDKQFKDINITESLVILDFKDLEYISSAGLRVLLTIKKKLDSVEKSLEIHNINPVVKEVFSVTGFKNVLTVK